MNPISIKNYHINRNMHCKQKNKIYIEEKKIYFLIAMLNTVLINSKHFLDFQEN